MIEFDIKKVEKDIILVYAQKEKSNLAYSIYKI